MGRRETEGEEMQVERVCCEEWSEIGGLGLEFLLTFVVVFVYFASVNPYKRSFGNPAVAVGLAYLACTLVGLPLTGASMNPARSLGPAFVKNKWDAHWVYWVGPLLGGTTAGLIYEYIFNPNRLPRSRKDSMDGVVRDDVGTCIAEQVESFPLHTVRGSSQTQQAGHYHATMPPLHYHPQPELPHYQPRLNHQIYQPNFQS
ncbi:hypothetical protein Pmani_007565 [Petrolisthes manimaculis]|uniref:Uncharacterized protein n=1 Tax=Petrolisthes manimaculis TaxID=1843537 RepID=A0AAE1UIL4_9EUCA|nr:hypothetical protein Pmani_007565 [Petrolisthes manimaculis]